MTEQSERHELGAEIRGQFPGASEGTYLNTAAEGLFLASHVNAMGEYSARKMVGSRGREACAQVESTCRSLAAQLLGVDSQTVAFLASTSRGLDAAIKSISWQDGDNIVFSESEFPNIGFASSLLCRVGVKRRLVLESGGVASSDAYAAQIDERTRLVVVSMVSYKNGFMIDLPQLAAVTHDRGSLLFVDAVQAAGAVPIEAGPADFLGAGTFKWLLGAHGLAVFYVNPRTLGLLNPPYVGYRGVTDLFAPDRLARFALMPDARRFEEGMPNYLGMYVLENALNFLLAIGIDTVAMHNARLVELVMCGLERLGVELLTPPQPDRRGSIVSFATSRDAEITRELGERGITVWGRDGRVRIAPHLYNTEEDIESFLTRLDPLLRES